MGPTPPGTGVAAKALFLMLSKSTSPTIMDFKGLIGSSMRLIPTSITVVPSLIKSAVMSCGIPIAAIKISAF